MPLPLPQRSLARQIIIKMGISIAAVIILIVVISYLYLSSGLKSQMLEQLEKYISERGKRESSIFMLAEDNHAILKKELLQQLNSLGDQDPQTEFEQLFVRWDDGVIRNQAEGFDGTRQVGVYIDKTLSIDADVRRRVLTFYDLIGKYGPAWHNRFQDTYITTPENIIVIYWPEYPTWAQDASADLYMPDEEYVWVADKKHNPSRLTSWTGVFYDKVSRLWMVSIETPVDIADRHIATVGHDIILNELLDRTIEDHLEGAYNLILRADGRLIAHPDKISDIQEQAGDFDILKSDDQHLIRIFESVKNIEPGQLVVENTADNEYLAVTKIEGPDWYFVTVYPKSLLSELPLKTIRFILILGIILLLIEAIVVFFILHKQVAQPLKQLSRVTRQLPQGELMESKDEKLISRQDEIGEIGGGLFIL
jgi:HAMP domain-containing protein